LPTVPKVIESTGADVTLVIRRVLGRPASEPDFCHKAAVGEPRSAGGRRYSHALTVT
jgi:hypothetical protein